MIRTLLCLLGFHRWRKPLWYDTRTEVCTHCWTERVKRRAK